MLLIGFAAFTGMAFAAPAPEPPATHEPTVIGDASRSVSPVGYTYTDPPAPFGVPAALPTRAKAHRIAGHKPAKVAKVH
ncbi:MAG TPA: hypothetical protein VG387_11725 [Rhizomicrobium sp.]|jgi:hypothetical protein|nr:hypothetical protein [Rhizomicrobium sp.]